MRNIFIDGGANKGQSTESFVDRYKQLNFKTKLSNWEIYIIEPIKECNHYLSKIKDKYKEYNINIIPKAIGINNNEISIYGGGGCSESNTIIPNIASSLSYKVKSLHLSKWIKENFNKNDYIFLKLDIEGAEYMVIEDLYKTKILSYINEFHGELHSIKKGFNINDDLILIERLKEYNLKLYSWNGSNPNKPLRDKYYETSTREIELKKWEKRKGLGYSKPDYSPLKEYQNNYQMWYNKYIKKWKCKNTIIEQS